MHGYSTTTNNAGHADITAFSAWIHGFVIVKNPSGTGSIRTITKGVVSMQRGTEGAGRMTRQEAIYIIEHLKPADVKDSSDAYSVGEALNMAIKALEQDPCDNCKYLDGDGCRLVFEQIEYGKASDECPSEDCISRQAVSLNAVKDLFCRICMESNLCYRSKETCEDLRLFDELPSVNPTKTGYWIEHKNNGMSYIECSKCSTWFLRMYLTRNSYCPNCGAKMVEPQGSEG